MEYAFIKSKRKDYALVRLCEVLEVSTSGYYDWNKRPLSQRDKDNQRLTTKLHCFHKASFEIYGSPNLHKDLIDDGEQVGINRVARLMRQANIQSKISKRFVITTNSKNTQQPAPDLLKRNFNTSQKNKAWVTDTTFIGTREGWLYLATVLDLYSRKIIGWSMGNRNNRDLVCDALMMALWRRKHPKGGHCSFRSREYLCIQ